MLQSIFSTTETIAYGTGDILICTAASLILGLFIAIIYHLIGESSNGYKISLIVLPVLVQAVIMMVNGNLGTSVAVLGAFSLVRFRSMPGSSKEIAGVFFAMAIGLANAMGCIGFACILTLLVAVILIAADKAFNTLNNGEKRLHVTIPENLDYTTIFDDIFEKYAQKAELENVKTTNMGSMFELSYKIRLRKDANEKEMIDNIRCKNGNLKVMCSRTVTKEAL